jgi:hypothetical protein
MRNTSCVFAFEFAKTRPRLAFVWPKLLYATGKTYPLIAVSHVAAQQFWFLDHYGHDTGRQIDKIRAIAAMSGSARQRRRQGCYGVGVTDKISCGGCNKIDAVIRLVMHQADTLRFKRVRRRVPRAFERRSAARGFDEAGNKFAWRVHLGFNILGRLRKCVGKQFF